jgi:uncharacterized protein YndB with AHSA1/START domain
MRIACFALILAAAASASAQVAGPVRSEDSTQVLRIELTIPASVHDVWEAFTTKQGLSSWLAPDVSVELKPGGDWLVKFPGSTGGGTIVSFVPEQEIVISALAPDRFPHVRAARTHAVFKFTSTGNGTLVSLTQTGWQSGAEWDAAYEYLAAGDAQILALLHHRFVAGPTDWQKAMSEAAGKSAHSREEEKR